MATSHIKTIRKWNIPLNERTQSKQCPVVRTSYEVLNHTHIKIDDIRTLPEVRATLAISVVEMLSQQKFTFKTTPCIPLYLAVIIKGKIFLDTIGHAKK